MKTQPIVEPESYTIQLVLATSTGGVGRHVAMLACGLRAAGHQVTVSAPAATGRLFGFAAGGSFTPLEIADRPRPLGDLKLAWQLRHASRGADVVHAHGLRAGAVAALALSGSTGRGRLVVTVHNAVLGGAGRRWLGAAITAWVVRRADLLLAVSPDLIAELSRSGRRVERALVAAPSVGHRATSAAVTRAVLGVDTDDALVLAVGRLHPQKGFDDLIAAADLLAAVPRGRPMVIAIAGEGPARSDLVAAASVGRARVRFLGHRDDVPDLLAAADVVVMPSRWEGWPLTAGQVLGAGRPFIATAVGGLPELVGDAALLVPFGDPEALAAAVTSVLTDPALAARLAVAAVERAAQLPTEEDVTVSVLAAYRGVLTSHR